MASATLMKAWQRRAAQHSQARKNALNTFWSAYVLDRRWSFGTGLPYVCHDDKIDPKLPYPVRV